MRQLGHAARRALAVGLPGVAAPGRACKAQGRVGSAAGKGQGVWGVMKARGAMRAVAAAPAALKRLCLSAWGCLNPGRCASALCDGFHRFSPRRPQRLLRHEKPGANRIGKNANVGFVKACALQGA